MAPNQIAICLLLASLSSINLAVPSQAQETPAQVVAYFLALQHGIYKLSEEDRTLFAKVKSNPSPYIDAIRAIYATPEDAARQASNDAGGLQFERAITLLGALESPAATDLLGLWYARLDDAAGDQSTDTSLILRRRQLLDALDRMKSPEVTTRVLNRLDRLDFASRVAVLSYLRRTGRNDPQVIESLRRHLADKNSPLYGNRSVELTLRSIESH